jgi:hypothetical protein
MDMRATVQELLEAVFSMQSALRLYSKGEWGKRVSCPHEFVMRQSPAGKDVSTEAEDYLLLGAVTR